MGSLHKTIIFVGAVTFLSLTVFPVFAQVQPIISTVCGFPWMRCSGNETFLGNDPTTSIQGYVLFSVIPIISILIIVLTVVYLLVAAILYITSTGDEDKAARAKRQIIYALGGLVLSIMAFLIVWTVIFQNTATLLTSINVYINFALLFFGTLATIFLIYAGFKYITSQGDEEASATAKRQILYALIGLFIAGTASIITTAVTTVDATSLLVEIRDVANAVLTVLSVAAVLYVILGGTMYMASQGDEDQAQRAKMQVLYAIMGVIVIALSAVLVNFIIGAI